jgi:signal transduction histidine kinase
MTMPAMIAAYGWGVRMRRWLLDLVVAGLVVTLAVTDEAQHGHGRAAAIAVTGIVAVLTRRRFPVPSLLAMAAGLTVTIVLRAPSQVLLFLIGLIMYEVTLRTRYRRPWLFGLGCATALFTVGMLADPERWWSLNSLGLYAWMCGGGAVGEAVRNRRAYVAEMTERVRQAEQNREELARRRVMDERLRIARELHDVVAHHIAVITVQAGAAGHVIKQHPEQAGPVLEVIREASDNVLREIKSVIGVLRDPAEAAGSTEPTPRLARVGELVEGLPGFDVSFEVTGEPRELPAIADLAAYRIVQEALTNAHRYGTGSADLLVAYDPERVTIEVTNGVGAEGDGSGFGLIGMRERAAAAGGSVTAGTAGDGRFRLVATLPTSPYALESSS